MKKALIIRILLIPVALFEYFVFLWAWFGGDTVNFFAVSVIYIIYMAVHMLLIKKSSSLQKKRILKYSAAFAVPILTILTWQAVAAMAGITITIA